MAFNLGKEVRLFGAKLATRTINDGLTLQSSINGDSLDVLVEDGVVENVISDENESNDLGIDE